MKLINWTIRALATCLVLMFAQAHGQTIGSTSSYGCPGSGTTVFYVMGCISVSTWTVTPTSGRTIVSSTSGSLTVSWSTPATYTITASGTCNGSGVSTPGYSYTVYNNVTPSVSITSNKSTICQGESVSFTATPVNGGTPIYSWYVNGNQISGANASVYSTTSLNNSDVVTARITSSLPCASNPSAMSNGISMTVNQPTTVTASITTSQPSGVCSGGGIAFTLSSTNGGSSPTIVWKVNGGDPPAGYITAQYPGQLIYNSWTQPNNSTVQAFVTSSNTCVTPVPAPSNTITVPINAPIAFTSSISVLPSRFPMEYCIGEISFSVSTSHPAASYAWFKNGDTNNVLGTAQTYTPVTFNQGDYVTVVVNAQANPCLSNTQHTSTTSGMPITIKPNVSISAISCDICTTNTRCQGGGTTQFNATASNSTGVTWEVTPPGAGSISSGGLITWNSSFVGTATISVAAAGCAGPAATNKVITVNPDQGSVTAAITTSQPSGVCSGGGIAFTLSSTNGGSSPTIVWKVNGGDPPAGYITAQYPGQLIYNSWTQPNNSTVQAFVTSSNTCVTPVPAPSNTITVPINAPIAFTSSISVLPSRFPMEYCIGEISFSVSTSHPAASYAWFKNGDENNVLETAQTYTPVTFNQGDYVSVRVNAQANPCLSNTQNTSTTSGMPITIKPNVSINAISCDICTTNTRCQGDGTTQFNAPALNSTGVTWSINPGDAGSISASGLMTWNSSYSGSATIKASAAGCYGPAETTKVIAINPTLPAPGVSISGTTDVCPGGGVGFTATGTNLVPGTTYTWHVVDGLNNFTVTSDVQQPPGPMYLILNQWNYSDGSYVYCVVNRGNQCSASNTATSDPVTVNLMTQEFLSVSLTTTPFAYPPVYCANEIDFVATASHPSTFSWYKNDNLLFVTSGNLTSSTYDPPLDFNSNADDLEVRIVASAGSCLSNQESSASLAPIYKIGLPVGDNQVYVSGAMSRCIGAGTTLFYALAENATAFQWTINPLGAGSVVASGTFNSSATVTWDPAFTGSATLQAVASGCNNSSDSEDYLYTVHPLPVVPAPSTLNYCDFEQVVLKGAGGGDITNHNWFDQSTNALGSGFQLPLDVKKSGTYTYQYEAISEYGCVNPDKASLTVQVGVGSECDNKLNWIESVGYNYLWNGSAWVESEISHSKAYFDLTGKGLQSQTKNFTSGQIFTAHTINDAFERPALATLSVPLDQTNFGYKHWIALDQQGGLYDYTDLGEPFAAEPGTVGWYYSAVNSASEAPKTVYPFSQTDYYTDGTGEARRSSAPGEVLRMGQGKETWSGTFPVYGELNDYLSKRRLIGLPDLQSDSTLAYEGLQTVARDQNGRFVVSIADKSGKSVMSARPGSSALTEHVLPVPNSIVADNTDAKKLTYFYLLEPTIVSITPAQGAEYIVHNLITDATAQHFQDANNDNKWPAGFYRMVVTAGQVTLAYTNYFLDVSYQFYDDAGRLKASVSPNGYKRWKEGLAYELIDKTTYVYNHQGWLLSMTEPDAGITRYVYRKDGKIRFSQNAEQGTTGRYSYTHYDLLGRPVESGEYDGTAVPFVPMTDPQFSSSAMKTELEKLAHQVTWTGVRKDWVKTFYDFANDSIPGFNPSQMAQAGLVQDYMRGAVSHTENENNKTWYSYDELGRVTWLAQWPKNMNVGNKVRVFVTRYAYDFLSNVLNTSTRMYVDGTEATSTAFHHHYTYDADKRLVKVETSPDGTNKKTRAEYEYYLHGPLKRIELGDKIQGIDFVYNIHGWLTQINHPENTQDPGGDGQSGTHQEFKPDAFGMVLDYYENTLANVFAASLSPKLLNPGLFHGLPTTEDPVVASNMESLSQLNAMDWREIAQESFKRNEAVLSTLVSPTK